MRILGEKITWHSIATQGSPCSRLPFPRCSPVAPAEAIPGRRNRTSSRLVGTITKTIFDGASDDLLTAGLGKTGLAGTAPVVANPIAPTAAELRKLAIFTNYRAILDISANGGYGSLYGPNIDVNGNPTLGEGKVAGTEYLAYADDGTGKLNVTMIVQIPASSRRRRPAS